MGSFVFWLRLCSLCINALKKGMNLLLPALSSISKCYEQDLDTDLPENEISTPISVSGCGCLYSLSANVLGKGMNLLIPLLCAIT